MDPNPLLGEWHAELADREADDTVRQPELGFDADGRMHGCGGVNRLMGSYTLEGSTVAFGQTAMTMMAGSPEAMAYEQAFVAALADPLELTATGEGLDLTRDGSAVLRLTRPS